MSSLGAARQTTYRAIKPIATHFRQATCQEVNCLNYTRGWKTILPVNHEGINWIRQSNYRYNEVTDLDNNMVEFIFEAGQNCFKQSKHVISLDKPAIFAIQDANGLKKQEANEWIDKFDNHLTKLKGEING
tara:strand:+ start:229 stop:621 length:393 start_codon:yes stop_codon:yes gene_type:complete